MKHAMRYTYIDKKGKDRSDWFPVSVITSVTRTIEKERKRTAIIAKHKLVDQFEEKPVERCQVIPAEQFLEKPVLQCEEKPLDRCGRKSGDLCKKELTYKNKVKLRSGTAKRKKTSLLDIEENTEIEKVIRLSRRFAPKGANTENLEKLLLRNLRIVDVLGNSNCFFRALSHRLFGDAESHQIVRQAATDQVLRNPEIYTESLINNDISIFCYRYRRIENGQTITQFRQLQMINSNSVSFAPVAVLPQGIPQNLVNKRIILGHIDQVHFVSTEFNSPFPTNSWGGYSKRLRKRLINTCPLDGPLIWLVNCAYF